MFGGAFVPVTASRRRNFQRKRQRHLLRRRLECAVWGAGAPIVGIPDAAERTTPFCFDGVVGPPPGLGSFYSQPAAHAEIDYDTFSFDLADKDFPLDAGGPLRH